MTNPEIVELRQAVGKLAEIVARNLTVQHLIHTGDPRDRNLVIRKSHEHAKIAAAIARQFSEEEQRDG